MQINTFVIQSKAKILVFTHQTGEQVLRFVFNIFRINGNNRLGDYHLIGFRSCLWFYERIFKQLAAVVGLIAGLLVARALFASLGEQLAVAVGTSVTFGQILAFLLIGLIVPLVLSLLASALTKIVDMTGLGFINRLLGAVLGVIKYALVISLVIHFIDFADSKDNLIHSTTKGSSLLYYPIKDFPLSFILW